MIDQQVSKNFSQSVNVLIFIFPIVINSLQVAGDIILFILAMMGIFIAISQQISPFIIKEIKIFSYLTIGYFTAICLSVLFSGQMLELAHYIPRDFYFLFAPFIALTLYKVDININYLLAGVKVGLIILGIIVLNQQLAGVMRPSGVMNAGVFGNLSVSLFFITLVFFEQESFKNKIFNIFSLLSGLFIIISSGTRGAWLSFLLLTGLYLYFFYKKKSKFSMRAKVFIVVILISLLSIGGSNEYLKKRVNLAYYQISSWSLGDQSINPVSERLNMYKKAIDNIENVPLFGYGLRTSNVSLFKDDLSMAGIVAARYNHLHNAYLTSYYNGGIFSLGALLLLLLFPLSIFIKANIQDRKNPIYISGAFLTLGYSSYGMVNILLGDTYMNGFYVFFLAIFLLLTNKSIKY